MFGLVTITSFLVLFLVYSPETTKGIHMKLSKMLPQAASHLQSHEAYLVGPPTKAFRDNLRPEKKYITGWTDSLATGWTNNVMTYINLIYIARLTERISILGPFYPGHLPESAGPMNVGAIFDLPKLSNAINLPVLEWSEVKDFNATDAVVDDLGCWSVWAVGNTNVKEPRRNDQEASLKIDASYTPAPKDAKLFPELSWDFHVSFWGLAKLGFPQSRKKAINGRQAQWKSKLHGHALPPDDQLLCYDFLYFTSAYSRWEYGEDFSPEWRFVGTLLDWTPEVKRIGDEYLRKAFGSHASQEVPSYIGIHIRRTDFGKRCKHFGLPLEECLASLDSYATRVEEIRAELQTVPHFNFTAETAAALPVLVMSDDDTPEFWGDVTGRGWVQINHTVEGTEERYGQWYTAVLDGYFQSRGVGFVGTEGSTMSLLAERRVQDWQGGVTREVKWGKKDADAHRR